MNTARFLPQTARYLKIPLIILNAILWLLGLVLVIVGGLGVSFFSNFKEFTKDSGSYKDALSQITTTAPTGILVIGILFIILTIGGCLFAYRESLFGLVLYTVVMLVLLVALIGVGGKALTLHNEDVVASIGSAWDHVSNSSKNATITKLEDFLECCGWTAQSNYTYLCPNDTETGLPKYKDTPCEGVMTEQVSSKLMTVGISGIVIGIFELLCMAFSLFMIVRICRSPRSRSSYDQY